jgi:hypothetical protein
LNLSIKNEDSLNLIRIHELNHIRTDELLSGKSGELKLFYSEILADILLIKELSKDSEKLKLKFSDVDTLSRVKNISLYYTKYLLLIKTILLSENYLRISSIILEKALKYEFQRNSIDELENDILEIIKNNS